MDVDVVKNDINGKCTVPVPFRDGEYRLEGGKGGGTFIIGDEKQRVKMTCWADDLKDTDWIGKSDPYFKVLQGKREILVSPTLSGCTPVWGEIQFDCAAYAKNLKIEVYDRDTATKDDLLGSCTIPIPVMNNRYSLGDDKGVFIIGEPWKKVKLFAWANNVKGEDVLGGKSDPYYVLKKADGDVLYKSESVSNTQTPVWERADFKTPVDEGKILVEIYDKDTMSKDDLLYKGDIPYPFKNGHYNLSDGAELIVGDDMITHELAAWADGLEDTDWFGKIEPYFTLSYGERELYKSDCTIKGTTPVWPTVNVDLPAGAKSITVRVYDKDVDKDDLLGTVEVPLPFETDKAYSLGEKKGFFVTGVAAKPDQVLAWADKLPKSDLIGTSDPYFTFSVGGKEIYKSEKIENTITPVWKEAIMKMPINTESIHVKVFDQDIDRDDLLGETNIPYPFRNGEYKMYSPEKKGKKQHKSYFMIGDEKKRLKLRGWADNLEDNDLFGNMEVYYKVFYGDRHITTSAVLSDKAVLPVWMPTFCQVPMNADKVTIKVFDKDTLSADDCIGTCDIPVPGFLQDLLDGDDDEFATGEYDLLDKDGKETGKFMVGDAVKRAVLNCSAENLKKADLIGKSDPYFEIWTVDEKPELLAKSKVQDGTLFPVWEEVKFLVPVNHKKLKITVKDSDVDFDDILGEVVVKFPFSNGTYEFDQPEDGKKKYQGSITLGDEKNDIELWAWADQLPKMDLFGKNDVYYKIKYGDRTIFKSKVSDGSTPVFRRTEFSVPSHIKEVKVELYDKDIDSDDFIGECMIPMPLVNGMYQLTGEKCTEKSVFWVGKPEKPAKLQAWCDQLIGLDVTGKSDPYYQVLAGEEVLYTSERLKNTSTPFWKEAEFRVPVNNTTLNIRVFDKDKTSRDDLIGSCAVPYPFVNDSYILWGQETGVFIVGDDRIEADLEAWADGLTGGGWFDKLEPYYKLMIGDREIFKSHISHESIGKDVKDKAKTPVWGSLKVSVPKSAKFLKAIVMDRDVISSDDAIGSAMIPFPFMNEEYKLEGCKNSDACFVVGPAAKPAILNASAEGLKDVDLIGKSDPFYEIWSDQKNSALLTKSEVVNNCHYPAWDQREFSVPVNTEEVIVKVYDDDVADKDLLGQVRVPFPFVNGEYVLADKDNVQGTCGKFIIGDEQIKVDLKAYAENIVTSDFFGSGDPYYKIRYGDRSLYKSEASKGKTPVWKPAEFKVPAHVTQVNVQVSDKDTFSKDDPVGMAIIPFPFAEDGQYELEADDKGQSKSAGTFVIGEPAKPVDLLLWAEGLEGKDSNGFSDPYYIVKTGEGRVLKKSGVQKKTNTPVWDVEQVYVPLNTNYVTVEIFDDDLRFA